MRLAGREIGARAGTNPEDPSPMRYALRKGEDLQSGSTRLLTAPGAESSELTMSNQVSVPVTQVCPWLMTWTLPESVALLIGCVVGLLLALATYGHSFKSQGDDESDASSDPRLKALLYAVGGMIATGVTDWSKLGKEAGAALTPIDSVALVLLYLLGLFVAFLVTLLIGTFVVYLMNRGSGVNGHHPYSGHAMTAAVDFLMYGYGHVRARIEKAAREKTRIDYEGFKNVARHMLTSLAGDAIEIERFLANPSPDQRRLVCKSILSNICIVAERYMNTGQPNYESNANWMLAVPVSNPIVQSAQRRFEFGDRSRYRMVLVLGDYARDVPHAPTNLVLPVEPSDQPGWADRVLPGAPEAYARCSPVIAGRAVCFNDEVPNDIRRQVRDEFTHQNLICFVSLVIPVKIEDRLAGIVNIETNDSGPLRKNAQDLNEMVSVLQPWTSLLGVVLAAAWRHKCVQEVAYDHSKR